MPVTIEFTDQNDRVQKGVEVANALLRNPQFYQKISEKDLFDLDFHQLVLHSLHRALISKICLSAYVHAHLE